MRERGGGLEKWREINILDWNCKNRSFCWIGDKKLENNLNFVYVVWIAYRHWQNPYYLNFGKTGYDGWVKDLNAYYNQCRKYGFFQYHFIIYVLEIHFSLDLKLSLTLREFFNNFFKIFKNEMCRNLNFYVFYEKTEKLTRKAYDIFVINTPKFTQK